MLNICTCSECSKDFEPHRYGFGIKCPHCHVSLDVFPDDVMVIQSKFGTLALIWPKTKSFWDIFK